MEEKVDMRITKTQRAIKNIFFELMEEVGFSKITVKEIIERAEINRSTFYLHYNDKFDLLDKMENDLLIGFRSIGITAPIDRIISHGFIAEYTVPYFNQLTSYIYENGKIFTLLISANGDPVFISKLSDLLKSVWTERQISKRLSIPEGYAFAAFIGMITSLISEWVKNGYQETPEAFGNIMVQITKGIYPNIIK